MKHFVHFMFRRCLNLNSIVIFYVSRHFKIVHLLLSSNVKAIIQTMNLFFLNLFFSCFIVTQFKHENFLLTFSKAKY